MNMDGCASGCPPLMKMGLGARSPPPGIVPACRPPVHTCGSAPDICQGANCIVCPPPWKLNGSLEKNTNKQCGILDLRY